jgi:protein-tyrosine phosphatase
MALIFLFSNWKNIIIIISYNIYNWMELVKNIYYNINAFGAVLYDKTTSKIFEMDEDKINQDELTKIKNIHIENMDATGNRIFEQPNYLVQYGSFFSNPTFIVDNLYLGSAFNAANFNTLTNHNIGLIINVTEEISSYHKHDEIDKDLDDFEYIQYKILDNHSHSIKNIIIDAFSKIKEYQSKNVPPNKRNILVHCFMGSSRSASVIIYYLMKEKNMSFEDSIKDLKLKRTLVNPSKVFVNDILEILNF